MKLGLSIPDGQGGSKVFCDFETVLELIKQADELSLQVPKTIYLVGWQYNGHDDKYPAMFEVNEWLKRPEDKNGRKSPGHHESLVTESEYQKKALHYWHERGIDVTSEWVMDYMTGLVPFAWHFNARTQEDYLNFPAHIYTGSGINPDVKGSDFGLGFLFGQSMYGEGLWPTWQKN